MNKKPITYHIGNFFMALGIVLLLSVYYPLMSLYLFPPMLEKSVSDKFLIQIPKIRAQAAIISSVDPWNEKEYNVALQSGVAHAKGTSLPGEKGTVFLFAHSSADPWTLTRENTAFLRLGELEKGDKITIFREGKEYIYTIVDKKEVWPTEVNYIKDTEKNQLILQTCTPIGTSLKRLLVFATPQ